MRKKFLAVALAAAMTVTSVGIVSAAETVEAPEPTYLYDFEDGLNGATIEGSGKIVDDTERGKVFDNNSAEAAEMRVNYLSLPQEVIDAIVGAPDKKVSFSIWVKAPEGSAMNTNYGEFSPLLAMKDKDSGAEWWPLVSIGLRGSSQVNCDGYLDNNTASDVTYLNDNEWHNVIATISDAGMTVYVDGNVANHADPVPDDPDTAAVDETRTAVGLFGKNVFDTLSIGGNQINTWNDLDANLLYDDIAIYVNKELTADEVAAIVAGTTDEPEAPDLTVEKGLFSKAEWSRTGDSKNYVLEEGDEISFDIEFTEGMTFGEQENAGKFTIEVHNEDEGVRWFFTTNSDKNAWWAENSNIEGNVITGVPEDVADRISTIVPGKTYTVTVARAADTITITYVDKETGEEYAKFVGTSINMPETLNVQFIAQIGTYNLSTEAKVYEAPTVDPSDDPTDDPADNPTDDPAKPGDNTGDDGKTDTDDGKTDTDNGNNNTGNNGAANDNGNAGNGGSASVDQPAQTGDVAPYMILVLGAAAAALVVFARKREEA